MRCEPCHGPDHTSADCENRDRPMCHRTCACTCDRPERDPAPYWTNLDDPAPELPN